MRLFRFTAVAAVGMLVASSTSAQPPIKGSLPRISSIRIEPGTRTTFSPTQGLRVQKTLPNGQTIEKRGLPGPRPGFQNTPSDLGWSGPPEAISTPARPALQNSTSGWSPLPRTSFSNPGAARPFVQPFAQSFVPTNPPPNGVSPAQRPGFANPTGAWQPDAWPPDAGQPEPAATAPAFSNRPIVILGPDDADVVFRLQSGDGDWQRTVTAGRAYKFAHDRDWSISFHRGVGDRYRHYRILPAVYQFRLTENGWELVKKADL